VNVIGLDLSTARVGFAATDGELLSISGHAKADDPYRRLHELRREIARAIRDHPPRPTVAVVEDYALGGKPGTFGILSKIRLGEIGGIVRTDLFELDVPIALVRPSTLKRFATGNGNADKPAMVARAHELGGSPRNDDEADAFHARRMGICAYGDRQGLTVFELDAIGVVTWPQLR
jgi:crossover junction endodeoxyribonuclease RuvC